MMTFYSLTRQDLIRIKKILVILVGFFTTVMLTGVVYADDKNFAFQTGCTGNDSGSYTAILDIASVQSVYVKLGTRGQKLPVSAYQVNESRIGECRTIGAKTVNGDTWTLVGTLQPGEGKVVLEINSEQLSNVPDAGRPLVMLLDPDDPVCSPEAECNLIYQGKTAYIRAPTTLQDKASLLVGVPISPANDELLEINYYASGRLAYKTKTLEKFDARYISFPNEDLLRVARYKSGQELVYHSAAPTNFSDSLPNLLFRTFNLDSTISKIVLFFVGLILLLLITYISFRLFVIRFRRLILRGLVRNGSLYSKVGARVEYWFEILNVRLEVISEKLGIKLHREVEKQRTTIKFIAIFWILPIILLVSYFTTTHLVATIYKVNGVSMESTFHDKQSMLVNKLPQTIARFNHEQLKLKRGDVVIIDAIYGLVSADEIDKNEHIIVKRVLGLPGERVTVTDGVVRVYNRQHPEGLEIDKNAPWAKTMHKDTAKIQLDLTLAADEIFISGDNRPESIDSRLNGPVKVDQIIGKVVKHW